MGALYLQGLNRQHLGNNLLRRMGGPEASATLRKINAPPLGGILLYIAGDWVKG